MLDVCGRSLERKVDGVRKEGCRVLPCGRRELESMEVREERQEVVGQFSPMSFPLSSKASVAGLLLA